jgi:hypothetical protein
MSTSTCETCTFAAQHSGYQQHQCRRNAPSLSDVPEHLDLRQHVPSWPIVRSDDWCGEHRATTQPAPIPVQAGEQTINPMCERKTNEIMQRQGYTKTGYVLMIDDDPEADICVSDQGAVAWFTREQWNWLMRGRDHVEFQWPKPITAIKAGGQGGEDGEITDTMADAGAQVMYGHTRAEAVEWAKEDKFDSCADRAREVYKAMRAAITTKEKPCHTKK